MSHLHLVWTNLARRKARNLFTVGSIVAAFVLYAYLESLDLSYRIGAEVAGTDRLIVLNKVSITRPLTLAHRNRLERAPGVLAVTPVNWLGGYYREPRDRFNQFAVDPEPYLEIHPEIVLSAAEREAFLDRRTAAVVGRATAERFGWRVGDRVPLRSPLWRRADGSDLWELDLVGIYESAREGTDTSLLLFHYDYLNGGDAANRDLVNWYVVRIGDPAAAAEVAGRLDALFANSSAETRTTTERAFAQSFAAQIGDIGAIVRSIVAVTFFIILLVTGNTMAQAVRERTGELAVLKALGFSDRRVLGLVVAESLALALPAAAAGLALGSVLIRGSDPRQTAVGLPDLPPAELATGLLLGLSLGVAAGLLPGARAMRLRIVEALRRGG